LKNNFAALKYDINHKFQLILDSNFTL